MERELKETSKQRFDLEADLRGLENEFSREKEDHYDNTMTIIKDAQFSKLEDNRYLLEVKLNEELKKAKVD